MRVVANRAVCEGHSVCASLVPEVFDVGDDDHVVVLDEHPGDAYLGRIRAAVQRCPKQVLALTEE